MRSGGRVLVAVVFLGLDLGLAAVGAGCGQDAPAVSTPADRARFIGSWNVVSATLAVTCSNHMDQTFTETDPLTVVMGTTSDLTVTGSVCPLDYNVVGRTATAVAGQICSSPLLIPRVHVTDDTFVITDSGAGAHHGSGMLSQFTDLSQGSPVKCTFIEDGTYQRAPP